MTASEIIARIRKHGGDVILLEDGKHLSIQHRSTVPSDLANEAKAHAADLRALLREHASSLEIAKAIRERRYPIPCAPADCTFPIGEPGKACRRCGASWSEHHSIGGARS